MLLGAIAGAEMAMLDVGVKIESGSGVAAAQRYWRNNPAAAALQVVPQSGAKASKAA
jgi:alanine-glyoxylate transaminase/serine-glyoxylate transaminase/serine-pyruvate transaminase